MLARPPHVLVTTPESLAVMLAMESYRKTLRHVETVVVDEIHALAGNKRGAQLALLLESLEAIVARPLVRVGLSATIAPLERVAQFLAGAGRDCEVVDARGLRSVRLQVTAPFAGAIARLETVALRAHELTRDVRTVADLHERAEPSRTRCARDRRVGRTSRRRRAGRGDAAAPDARFAHRRPPQRAGTQRPSPSRGRVAGRAARTRSCAARVWNSAWTSASSTACSSSAGRAASRRRCSASDVPAIAPMPSPKAS